MARLRTWKSLSISAAVALMLALGAVAVPMVETVEATIVLPAEVWVDNDTCPATGNGSVGNPFCSIQDGIDNVAKGGTVHVYPGKYDENIQIIDKPLTLRSVSGNWQDTIIDDEINQAEIIISGHADVTVQGFQITGGSSGIYIGEVESTVNILDCFIHDNAFDGIRVASSGDVLNVERNIISQNGYGGGGCGIHMNRAWNTTNIRDNIIGAWWDGEGTLATYNGNQNDGIDIDDVAVGTELIIEGNHIPENGIIASGDHGINLDIVAGSVHIQDNVIGAWTYCNGGGSAVGFNGNKNHGIHVGPVSHTGSINIEGNAISDNGNDGINFDSGVSPILGEVTILGNLIGAWTCHDGDYGYSGVPRRYYGNRDRGIEIIQVGAEAEASGTVTIEGNKISENHRGEVDETGIYIEYTYGVVTIEGNDIGSWTDRNGASYLGNNGAGILIANVFSGAELTIGPDNSIKNNLGDGIDIALGEAGSDIEIHHNQIDANGRKEEVRLEGLDLDQIIIEGEGCGIKLGSGGVSGAIVSDNVITNHHEGIYLDSASAKNTIQGNVIRDNGHGIWVEGDDNRITRNDILHNAEADSGIHLTSTAERNSIHCNNIEGNYPGISNENVNEVVDAISNWWGDASGPSGAGPGSGDAVSQNVNYSSWLSAEFQYCRECQGLPAPAVPTVNHWGIVAMITLFAGLLVWTVRRRQLAL